MAGEQITTQKLVIPEAYVATINEKIKSKSVIASLKQGRPKMFANANYMVFSEKPHGEFIGEGEAKNPSTATFTPVVGKPHKFQTTIRMTEEVVWADEDSRMGLLDEVIEALGESVGEGLDYGLIHGWNPRTKSEIAGMKAEALATVANKATATGNIQTDIDNLPDAVLEAGYKVDGIALDLKYANELRKLRNENTGAKVYPEVNLNLEPGSLEGLRAATSNTVAGEQLGVENGPEAIIGDWDMLDWGFVREFNVEPIYYGDPDGLGDLKRYNQVAYRVEAVFSWAILDPKAFAALKAA
jgi:HK97 family phage major capsid protein